MNAHIGVDAGTGYVHSVTATAASVHDQIVHLVRADDDVVYADYQGAGKTTPKHHHRDQNSASSTHHARPEAPCMANRLMISASLDDHRV